MPSNNHVFDPHFFSDNSYERIILDLHAKCLRWARRMLQAPNARHEAASVANLAVALACRQFPPKPTEGPEDASRRTGFAFQTVRRIGLETLRKAGRFPETLASPETFCIAADSLCDQPSDAVFMAAALQQLSSEAQRVLSLRAGGLSRKTIAAQMGLTYAVCRRIEREAIRAAARTLRRFGLG